MGNNAVNVNAPVGVDIHITNGGSSWLWAVFSIFTFATLVFLFLGTRRKASDRFFNYIIAAITLISALTYYSMASNLGYTGVAVEFLRLGRSGVSGNIRQIFWVRYIQYFINLPLIVLALLLTARVPAAQILFTILATAATVVCMLVGALVPTSYKWGYFVLGLAIFLYVFYAIFQSGRRYSNGLGADIGKAYKLPAIWFTFFMLLYPIVWGLSEGGNVISPNGESIFYGILDLLHFLGFGALLTFGHRSIEPARLGLRMRTHDEELGGSGRRHVGEKSDFAGTHNHGANGASHHVNGTQNGVSSGTHNGVTNGNHTNGNHTNVTSGTHNGILPGTNSNTVDHTGTGLGASGHEVGHNSAVPTTGHSTVDARV